MMMLMCLLLLSDPRLEPAERAYEQGLFAEAAAQYLALLSNAEFEPALLLYNLGNCSHHLERYPEAVWYYRRALHHDPGDLEARHNLALAEARLGIDVDSTKRGPAWRDRWDRQTSNQQLLWACAMQASGLLAWLVLRRRRIAWIPVMAITMLGVLMAVSVMHRHWAQAPQEAVVLVPSAALHDRPHSELPIRLRLRAGETVTVSERSDRWMRIEVDEERGWVTSAALGVIE